MALLFMESFGVDSLANMVLGGRWDANNQGSGNTLSIVSSGGPFNDYYFRVQAPQRQSSGNIKKALNVNYTTLYFGFYYYPETNGGSKEGLVTFLDGATLQTSLVDFGSGSLGFVRGDVNTGTTLGTPSAFQAPAGAWTFIEAFIVFNTTTGQIQCKANGVDIVSLTTGLNTAASGVSQANALLLGNNGQSSGTGNGWNYRFANFRINDNSGAQNNSFLGAKRVSVFRPSANSATVQFTPLAGSNFSEVNANPSTGDASYNSTATVGNKDLFTHAAASGLTNIAGVQVSAIRRIDNAGPDTDSVIMYDGTTEVDATAVGTPTTYQWNCAIRETELTGGAFPLTNTDITNMQFGYKLVS